MYDCMAYLTLMAYRFIDGTGMVSDGIVVQ